MREIGWDEAKRMIGAVAAMDEAAFQIWHAQSLATRADDVQPTAGARVGRRLAQRERLIAMADRSRRSADDRVP